MQNLEELKVRLEAAHSELQNKQGGFLNINSKNILTLSGNNNYFPHLNTCPGNTLTVHSDQILPGRLEDLGTIQLSSGTLTLHSNQTLPGRLKGQGNIQLNGNMLTILQENLLNEFSGRIIGPGNVAKNSGIIQLQEGQILAMIEGELKRMDENTPAQQVSRP